MIRFLFDFIVAVLDDAADSTGFPALDAGELAMILRRSVSLYPISIKLQRQAADDQTNSPEKRCSRNRPDNQPAWFS
ncbi:hypothetical protein [Methylobacter tundripaludum]|uniref:hypothetical protein n=1 Tax=Methylobacter tundripaludum TaxID=173365 RepID=UPI0002E20B32|nr:hypothetical protein [Methylobacter tundripaludum]